MSCFFFAGDPHVPNELKAVCDSTDVLGVASSQNEKRFFAAVFLKLERL